MRAPTPTKELIEEGNYIATVYRIIYLGTVETEYMGEKKNVFQVDITWELNNEMKVWKEGEEAKPVVVSKTYTLSLGSKSNLRPIVEGIVGGMSDAEAVNFDVDSILGKSCLLNITHGVADNGKEYLKLQTSKLMKGMEAPKGFNEQKILTYENWDEEMYQSLPEWLRTKIASTPEFKVKDGFEMPTINIPMDDEHKTGFVKMAEDDGRAKNVDEIPF